MSNEQVEIELFSANRMPKGTAVLEFSTAEEAETAMQHLDGGQIDGQIVKVSYVLVSQRRRRASPGTTTKHTHILPPLTDGSNRLCVASV